MEQSQPDVSATQSGAGVLATRATVVARMPDRPGPLTLFARALQRRCPNCGARGLFASWFRMRPNCPVCGIATERGEDGYVVGAYMFNIVAAELSFAGAAVAVVLMTWPNPPWNLLLYVGEALMIGLPFLFYPFSKTVFLALDLIFRPEAADHSH